jgi:hypothetical protein
MESESQIFGIATGEFIISLGTLLTAIFTAVVAGASWYSARETYKIAKSAEGSSKETKKIVLAQIINTIRDQFSSPELREYIDYLNTHKSMILDYLVVRCNENPLNYKDHVSEAIDNYRRSYAHIFHKLILLLSTQCIDEKFLKKIIYRDEVKLLIDVVEPLEIAKAKSINKEYNSETFDTIRRIYY